MSDILILAMDSMMLETPAGLIPNSIWWELKQKFNRFLPRPAQMVNADGKGVKIL